MSTRWGRIWFGLTFACALAGVALSVVNAANSRVGHFHPAVARAFNTFAYFTTLSNVLVGIVAILLALSLRRTARWFAVLELTALIAIVVTGVVYNTTLRGVADLTSSWEHIGNELVHLVVPVLMVVGWLLVGPRGLIRTPVIWLSLAFPLAWFVFTLIRGAIAHWYPYPFIDVTRLGYGGALVNCLWVAILFLGLAAGAGVLDRRLGR